MKKNILIGIPTYNEENAISNIVNDLNVFLEKHDKNFVFDVVFFDDGSIDKTVEILKNISNFKIIEGKGNKGLGFGIKSLLNYAKDNDYEGFIKLDGDNQMLVSDIRLFIDEYNTSKSDVIYGNRFFKESNYKMSISRKLGSKFFKFVFYIIGIKVKDPTNGFIFLSKNYINDFFIFGNFNAAQQILLDCKLRKLKFSQINISLEARTSGKSFIGIKYPIYVLTNMIGLLIFRKHSSLLMTPGILLLFIGLLLFIYNIYIWLLGTASTVLSDPVLIIFLVVGFFMFVTGLLIQLIKKDN